MALAACGSVATATGCTRTSDGSVVMSTPAMPSLFGRSASREAFAPDQRSIALAELPPATTPAPQPPRHANVSSQMGSWKVQTVKAPFERADPNKPLNCRNETSAQGRVRMTCL